MKYIRLKDGKIVDQYQTVRPQFVVKRADTIEELCDEFVFIDKNKLIEHRCWTNLEWAITNCKRNNIDISTIYGAIWTDKGLIYVAKMNDYGELELI